MRGMFAISALAMCAAACQGEPVEESPGDSATTDSATTDSAATDTTTTDSGTTSGDSALTDSGKTDSTSFEGGVSPCPEGKLASPPMVYVPSMKYCIDQNEVTDAEYNLFLLESSKPAFPARLKFCESRTSYGATRFSTSFPATRVEWCHAYQYCRFAGKRLCGKHVALGGGGLRESDLTTPTVSQWSFACKGGDPGTDYPYGGSYDATKCAVGLSAAADTNDVKYKACTGGLAGLRHMSGNASEWEDACNDFDTLNATSSCRTRGGWYTLTDGSTLKCETTHSAAITTVKAEIGFRCCADVP